jgi:hypothetical protein
MRNRLAVGLIGLALLTAACATPASISAPSPTVTVTRSNTDTSAIAVRAENYRVVVTATGPSWVASPPPSGQTGILQADDLRAGESRTYLPANGKLTVQLGSVQVRVTVDVAGRTVSGGRLTPTVAPSTMNFSSVA